MRQVREVLYSNLADYVEPPLHSCLSRAEDKYQLDSIPQLAIRSEVLKPMSS